MCFRPASAPSRRAPCFTDESGEPGVYVLVCGDAVKAARHPLGVWLWIVVAGLAGGGANNAEIAKALYISEGTARNRVSKILRKLGLRDRTALAVHAAKQGWTERAPERP